MAMDTAAKRHSAVNWGLPWRTLPLPDGSIGQGDRQSVGLCYAGILAGSPVALVYGPISISACEIYCPGPTAVELFIPGMQALEVYTPGPTAIEVNPR